MREETQYFYIHKSTQYQEECEKFTWKRIFQILFCFHFWLTLSNVLSGFGYTKNLLPNTMICVHVLLKITSNVAGTQ
jgi:hypothetical protein